ncbi:hypothetical protein D3C75_472360 [compost metagenome]
MLVWCCIWIDYKVVTTKYPGVFSAFFHCRHWIRKYIFWFQTALIQRLLNNTVRSSHYHCCTTLLECAYSITPAQCPVLRNRVCFPSKFLVEIQRFNPSLRIKSSYNLTAFNLLNFTASFEQEVGPVPACFIPFTHWSNTGNPFFGISYAFRGIQHIIPSPIHRWNSNAFFIQHFFVDHCGCYITLLSYAEYFSVNDKLVLENRVNLILKFVFIPQIRNVSYPAFFN